jgi:hypothetical protein
MKHIAFAPLALILLAVPAAAHEGMIHDGCPPNQTFGLHIMFIGPNQQFREGECVELTLTFEKAGELPVQLVVGPVGADSAPEGHNHH